MSELPKYVVLRKGRYFFQPSPAMRTAGFRGEPLGADRGKAFQRAKVLTDEWNRIQGQRKQSSGTAKDYGTIKWLVEQFQGDPTYYSGKSPRTRQDMDFAFDTFLGRFGGYSATAFRRRHARKFYNDLCRERSVHQAQKICKWVRRLYRYAVDELEIRDDNPFDRMRVSEPPHRTQRWTADEVQAVISAALSGGKHPESGNIIPPRPSVALGTSVAYDTSLPQSDILHLQWSLFDGNGFTVQQKKKRGQREVYCPVSTRTKNLLKAAHKTSTSKYIIVSEETGEPYIDDPNTTSRSKALAFSRLFRKFRKRAGVKDGLTFHDLRRTALSELGDTGATEAEITKIGGHAFGSQALRVYMHPDKEAAIRAARRRFEHVTSKDKDHEKTDHDHK
ncbi:MAG: tyrosine-type recombinase/integrase [Alphaproteobacteria bacterium]|nr:tyrosine-type recombinase/integrase [Alphaproteobacteria bacterium]